MNRLGRIGSALLLALAVLSCGGSAVDSGGDESTALTVYSGRNEKLIGPLLADFTQQTGIPVDVRYSSSSDLTALLLEEGDHTPADLFISQDAAALGALSKAGLLRPLAAAALERVDPRFRSTRGDWLGLSGRARVIVYNPALIERDDLPRTLEAVTDERYRGRWGVAPTNASFQAHMALYRALNGEQSLDDLLAAMVAGEPRRYPKNSPIVAAVNAGEIDFGLVNHYYLWRALKENPEEPGLNFFMPTGDASSFINIAGVGVLSEREEAQQLIEFLLSDTSQTYFAESTFEYPLVAGIAASVELPALESLLTPDTDYGEVAEALEGALQQIHGSGLLDH